MVVEKQIINLIVKKELKLVELNLKLVEMIMTMLLTMNRTVILSGLLLLAGKPKVDLLLAKLVQVEKREVVMEQIPAENIKNHLMMIKLHQKLCRNLIQVRP